LARAGTAPDATPSLPRRRALRVTPVRRLDCARRATFSALADGCFAGTAESPETCRPSARKPAVEPCVWSGASIWPLGNPHLLCAERAHAACERSTADSMQSTRPVLATCAGCCKHQSSSRAASGRVAAPGHERSRRIRRRRHRRLTRPSPWARATA
jgi:hypothetical protein